MASPDDPLDGLIAQCLSRIESQGARALDELCRDHPEHASDLRRRVEQLAKLGLVQTAETTRDDVLPRMLGPYRLVERLGGGGMGVVFRAEQPSLGRFVAVKVLRPDMLFFPGAQDRFRREASTVARLQHPAIVPVYEFEEAGGASYLVMELAEGATLGQILGHLAGRVEADQLEGRHLAQALEALRPGVPVERGSTARIFEGSWVEACLRMTREIALALDHAHSRGVLHRDVKPSNIMLGPDGRVRLLDFGLATAQGTTKLTRSGAQLGSVPYMSPEQIRGEIETLDERTDVYSLGITLYELLTLQSPYYSPSSEESTRQRILEGRPTPIRELHAAVSWDVETACLAAMEVDRAQRYKSAGALAADLGRILELRPIEARRPNIRVRLARLARRHPAVTAAAVVGAVALVLGPAGYLIQEARARAEITTALEKAQKSFDLAVEVVDRLPVRLANDALQGMPGFEEVRRSVLEESLEMYQRLAEQFGSGSGLGARALHVHNRAGVLSVLLGKLDDAKQHFQEAIAMIEALGAANAPSLEQPRSLAGLAEVAFLKRDLDTASSSIRQAISLLESQISRSPKDAQAVNLLFENMWLEANIAKARGAFDDAQKVLAKAASLVEMHRAVLGEAMDADHDLGRIQMERSAVLLASGALDPAREAAQAAVLALRECLLKSPNSPVDQILLAQALAIRARVETELGVEAEARAALQESLSLRRNAVAQLPHQQAYRYDLVNGLVEQASQSLRSENAQEASIVASEAIELARDLTAEAPEVTTFGAALGSALHQGARAQFAQGDPKTAREMLEESVAIFENLDPEDMLISVGLKLAQTSATLGDLYLVLEQFHESAQALDRAKGLFLQMADADPAAIGYVVPAARALLTQSIAYERCGDLTKARASVRAARDSFGRLSPEAQKSEATAALVRDLSERLAALEETPASAPANK